MLVILANHGGHELPPGRKAGWQRKDTPQEPGGPRLSNRSGVLGHPPGGGLLDGLEEALPLQQGGQERPGPAYSRPAGRHRLPDPGQRPALPAASWVQTPGVYPGDHPLRQSTGCELSSTRFFLR